MDRREFISEINGMLKLVRTEYGLTQEKMADVLGISKKSLVESEKGRRPLGWTETVAFVSVFSQSRILQNQYGGELSDMVAALAFEDMEIKYPPTMGGRIWWKTVAEEGEFRVQQNIVSKHYRLLDGSNCRVMSSFDFDEIRREMECHAKG